MQQSRNLGVPFTYLAMFMQDREKCRNMETMQMTCRQGRQTSHTYQNFVQGMHINNEISLLMLWIDLCTSQQSNLKSLTRKTYNYSLIQQPNWLELVLNGE